MKEANIQILKEAAEKLMFSLTDEEAERLLNEFKVIFQQMELIGKIEGVDDATPMTFPFECENSFLREDIPTPALDRDEALKNAKDVVDGQIRLPKVVG